MANDWHEDGVEADTEQQKIKINIEKTHHSHHRDYEHDKENNYYSSEEENLLDDGKKGGKKKRYKEKVTEVKEDESAKKCYHPVKFVFKPVEELDSGMASVKIEQHESELTFVRTYPTGITNKAFASTYSHKKVSERLNESAWNDKYVEKIKGYFVSNSAKHSVRLQTDEGSYCVRSLESHSVLGRVRHEVPTHSSHHFVFPGTLHQPLRHLLVTVGGSEGLVSDPSRVGPHQGQL